MSATDLILTDPDILGGKPVFKGTRVPVNLKGQALILDILGHWCCPATA